MKKLHKTALCNIAIFSGNIQCQSTERLNPQIHLPRTTEKYDKNHTV